MSQQHEALQLADAWHAAITTQQHAEIGDKMADELRRLHAENEALKAAWQPLSVARIKELSVGMAFESVAFTRAIEAAHGIKP